MTHDTPTKQIWVIEYPGEAVPRSGEWVAEQSDAPEGANSYTLTSHADAMVAAALRDLARQLLATMAERDEAQAAQAATVERAAEMAAEIHSSLAAAIRALADPTGVKLLAELRARAERADELGKRLGRRIHAQRVRLRQMEGFKCRCCDLMALRLQRLKRSNEYRARAEAAEAQLAEAQKWVAWMESALELLAIGLGSDLGMSDIEIDTIRDRATLSAAPTGEESHG